MLQLVFNLRLLIQNLFQSVVARLLGGLDLSTEELQRLVHLESDLVPFEVLDVILDFHLLGGSPIATNLNDELRWLIQVLADVKIHLFIPLATCIDLGIVLLENVHQLH